MEWIGYAAALLVFCTFYMRTMMPLRCTAIASNSAFLAYAAPLHLWPIVVLHGLLLPLNVLRMIQLNRTLAQVRAASANDIDVTAFLTHLMHEQYSAGAVLFRRGDRARHAYYIAEGEVRFPELGIKRGAGSFIGEIGVFGSYGTRTASAECASAVTLYRIDERDLVTAFYQRPALAFALVRLIADRMAERISRDDARLAATGASDASCAKLAAAAAQS